VKGVRPVFVAAGVLAAALTVAHAQRAPTDTGVQAAAPAMDWIEEPLPAPRSKSGPTAGGGYEILPGPMDWRAEPLPPAGSTTGTAAATAAGSRIGLSPQEQSVIRDAILREDVALRYSACRNQERIAYSIGRPYPRTTRICHFPDEVKAKVPNARRYRYLVVDDEIILIDPADHRIVEVLK
jgi:hypothetical protein